MKTYTINLSNFEDIQKDFLKFQSWEEEEISLNEIATKSEFGFNLYKINTPGHGYYRFNRDISSKLNKANYKYSFFSKNYAFLEEDCDTWDFLKSLRLL